MKSTRQHNAYHNMTLTDAVNMIIGQSGYPEKGISADIGKPLSTLQRELNPHDDGAKLGVDTLFPLIRSCCGDNPGEAPEPLVWLCKRLGFEPVKIGTVEPNADTIERECLESVQSVSAVHAAIMEGKHPHEVEGLIMSAKKDLDQDGTLYRRTFRGFDS